MRSCFFTFLVFFAYSIFAETNAPPRHGPPTGWSTSVQGGSVYALETDMDHGGSFSVNRYYMEGSLAYLFRVDRRVSFSFGYGQDNYDFSGVASEPWNNIENYRANVFTRWGIDGKWAVFAVQSIRSSGEPGVSMDDALSGAVFGGASCRFSDRLALGPGFGVVGEIEDDPRYFPVLIIDWEITDRLRLGTGSGLASTAGPGLTLSYKATRHWQYALSTRYENKRFRLDGQGSFPDGVGEDRNVPVIGTLSYQLYPGTSFSGLFGLNLGGKLRVEDRDGNHITSYEYDYALFLGLSCRISL